MTDVRRQGEATLAWFRRVMADDNVVSQSEARNDRTHARAIREGRVTVNEGGER